MEDPEVFAQTHALLLEWRRRGWVDGFRIDHPDGLLDPLGYFQRLAAAHSRSSPPPHRSTSRRSSACGERLRPEWPVAGTTGYDFLNQAEALFIDPQGYEAIEADYRRIIRQPLEFSGHRAAGEAARARDRALRRRAAPGGPPPQARRTRAARCPPCRARISSARSWRPSSRCRCTAPTWTAARPCPASRTGDCWKARWPTPGTRAEQPAALDLLEGALLAREGPVRRPTRSVSGCASSSASSSSAGPQPRRESRTPRSTPTRRSSRATRWAGRLRRPLAGAVGRLPRRQRRPRRPMVRWHAGGDDSRHQAHRRRPVAARRPERDPNRVGRAVAALAHSQPVPQATVRGRRVPDPATVYHIFQAMVGIWPLEPLGVGRSRGAARAHRSAT